MGLENTSTFGNSNNSNIISPTIDNGSDNKIVLRQIGEDKFEDDIALICDNHIRISYKLYNSITHTLYKLFDILTLPNSSTLLCSLSKVELCLNNSTKGVRFTSRLDIKDFKLDELKKNYFSELLDVKGDDSNYNELVQIASNCFDKLNHFRNSILYINSNLDEYENAYNKVRHIPYLDYKENK